MIIEILKAIESEIGIEIVINFLCLILGMGLGGGITDAIYSLKGEDNENQDVGGVYTWKKWGKEDEEKRAITTGANKAAGKITGRKGSADHSTREKTKHKGWRR